MVVSGTIDDKYCGAQARQIQNLQQYSFDFRNAINGLPRGNCTARDASVSGRNVANSPVHAGVDQLCEAVLLFFHTKAKFFYFVR